MMLRPFLALLAALLLLGCGRTVSQEVAFQPTDNPELLSGWNLFTVANGRITPHKGMIAYELNSPLFSDYAQKWRMIWMPKGVHATWNKDRWFDFPVGTVIAKTFYYTVPAGTADPQASPDVVKMAPALYQDGVNGLDLKRVRLIETRLLVKRQAGWVALPYVWNADGTDATLERTGGDVPLTFHDGASATSFTYSVPNQNQCAGCHVQDYRTRQVEPIGLKTRHMDRRFPGIGGDMNQLARLVAVGYLTGVPGEGRIANVKWDDRAAPVTARAQAYLDINCSHCHNATGAARTSGLWLDAGTSDLRARGLCKPPVAAGRGTGNRGFGMVPGHPEQSIIDYRINSTDPGEMMPELGRALVHKEGTALVHEYIKELVGGCDAVDGTTR